MGHKSLESFGVHMDSYDFADMLVDDFNAYTRGQITLDEMILRPTIALDFCNDVRRRHGYFRLPEDVILRAVMNRRKLPLQGRRKISIKRNK